MSQKNNILKLGGKNLDLENWKVYHPNGKHMFTCGGKKARWYLDRKLATEIGNNKIIFTFEPNGYGYDGDEEFGRVSRLPICVVTGVKENLQRHHIVPYCYRSNFPKKYKSKNHHDVVLINYEKHSEYELEATKFKDVLAQQFGIKTISEYNKEYSQLIRNYNRDRTLVLSKINALFKAYGILSPQMIRDNLEYVSEMTGLDKNFLFNCNYIQLLKLYNILSEKYTKQLHKFKDDNKNYYDHGWHLVKKLDTDDKIERFVKLWRKHFIDTMKPQFMPDGWSVDFRYKIKV